MALQTILYAPPHFESQDNDYAKNIWLLVMVLNLLQDTDDGACWGVRDICARML